MAVVNDNLVLNSSLYEASATLSTIIQYSRHSCTGISYVVFYQICVKKKGAGCDWVSNKLDIQEETSDLQMFFFLYNTTCIIEYCNWTQL